MYSDILLHVPLSDNREQIRAGVSLAKQFRAQLTGLCDLPATATVKNVEDSPFMQSHQSDAVMRNEAERAAAAEHDFVSAADEADVDNSWIAREGSAADLMIYACRLHNLAIVEQVKAESDLLWGPAVELALSGHATLVMPDQWAKPVAANHAVIGWNGSAQAAAAVRKALPLLKSAERATVLPGPPREALPDSVQTSLLDVVAYLERHGIDVTERASVNDEDAGEAILAAAEDGDADLVVMGAFGRSRFNEWILGGATRHVLSNMTVPVLMAH